MARHPIGLAILLVALTAARSFAGPAPGITLELEPTNAGVDLVPGYNAVALQDPSPPEGILSHSEAESWHLHVIPAFWVPVGFEGTFDVGPVRTDIDLDADDIFDALEFAIEGGLALSNEDWSILMYGSFFSLGADAKSQSLLGASDTSLDFDLTIIDVAVGKRIGRGPIGDGAWRADLLGGFRYWEQKIEISQSDPLGIDPMIDKRADWVDAFVGGRIIFDVNEKASLWFRGDVGGFSICTSSDLTWSLTTLLELKLDDRWMIVVGYRYIDVERDRGSGPSRIEYDYKIHGPIIGASMRF